MNKNKKSVKGVVFFDLDDTLFESSTFRVDVRNHTFKFLLEQGLESNSEELWELYTKSYNKIGPNGTNHFQEILDHFDELSKKDKKKLENLAVKKYSEFKKKKLNDYKTYKVEKVLETLKNRNYLLGIISSGLKDKQIDKLKRLNLLKYFEKNMIGIIGEKDKKLYEKCFDYARNKYKSENIWMVGDREDKDITPAKRAGAITIRIKGRGRYSHDYSSSKSDYKSHNFEDILNVIV